MSADIEIGRRYAFFCRNPKTGREYHYEGVYRGMAYSPVLNVLCHEIAYDEERPGSRAYVSDDLLVSVEPLEFAAS